MNKSKVIIALVALAIITFPAVITAFRVQTLLTATYEPAIVTDCRSYRGARRNYGRKTSRNTRAHTYHAPIAVSESGAIATGKVRLSERKWCENMIGQKTSIYVHPSNPDKNMIGSYLQFWLMPSLLFFGLCLIFAPISARNKILMGLGFALFITGACAREFGVFGVSSDPTNPVLDPVSRIDRCIEKWMEIEEVNSLRDLKKLSCERLEDLSSLSRLPKLKELSIRRSPLMSLETMPKLPNLVNLRLVENKELASLNGIERLENLEKLEISRNVVTDITALSSLKKLTHIASHRESFDDIEVLRDKMLLQEATFNSSSVKDLSPLYEKPSLMLTGANGSKVICEQVSELKRSLSSDAIVWVPGHCK